MWLKRDHAVDVCVLATALERLPLSDTRDDVQVAELHATARRLLLGARAALWTSDARGFDAQGRIPRQLSVIGDGPESTVGGKAAP